MLPLALAVLAAVGTVYAQADPPAVILTRDDTVINHSCRIVIPPGTVIQDANGDGVIHVAAPDIVLTFEDGSVLAGSPDAATPDKYAGVGVRVAGQANVTIRGLRVRGFRVGVWASDAPGLTLEDIDASHNFRQRLRSTPAAEDAGDWLSLHRNDAHQALNNYGAALYVERSQQVTVRRCRVRHGQNALFLDRVTAARVYDNGFSFNSGWGIALWRSCDNVISRNAIDFCVRGHSEGVYNRGQDSAGIIAFEQCSRNLIAENSVTHGGDGFFGFAGLEALSGEGLPKDAQFDFNRRGCNDNTLIRNDFSYAPAHGIEMTFSFGNAFIDNRVVENAICGVWGGYSQDTLIAGNLFEGNGGMAYGLERGGVNIEHGARNRIVANTFVNNRCGVHLWWKSHGDFENSGWFKANYKGVTDNIIEGNAFRVEKGAFEGTAPPPGRRLAPAEQLIMLHLRDETDPPTMVRGTVFANNSLALEHPRSVEIVAKEGIEVVREAEKQAYAAPASEIPGETRPVGARPHLRGRDKIIMTEWGPWDHESPLVRAVKTGGSERVYELHKMPGKVRLEGPDAGGTVACELIEPAKDTAAPWKLVIRATEPGVRPFIVGIAADGHAEELRGVFVAAQWHVAVFQWDRETTDPRKPEQIEAWRALATGPGAHTVVLDDLALKYGSGGPSTLRLSDEIAKAGIPNDYFGTVARSTVRFAKGRYRLKTMSDDGVRVIADGAPIIENWTWHGPTLDAGELVIDEDRNVELVIEHFEIDGWAVLTLEIEAIP